MDGNVSGAPRIRQTRYPEPAVHRYHDREADNFVFPAIVTRLACRFDSGLANQHHRQPAALSLRMVDMNQWCQRSFVSEKATMLAAVSIIDC